MTIKFVQNIKACTADLADKRIANISVIWESCMTKKRNKRESEKAIDTDMIKHFMLGGVDLKDNNLSSGSKAEVDLHLDETSKNHDFLTAGEKLNIQIKHLEKQIDRAIARGSRKIDVIHGKGEGRLKEAVNDYLKKHPQVKSYRLLTDRKHDGGATEVFFK